MLLAALVALMAVKEYIIILLELQLYGNATEAMVIGEKRSI